MANPVANTVDSISHAHFRSNFQTPEVVTGIVEMKQMRPSQLQIQGRGIHKYRQQRDPDPQTDLQSDLQKDLHPNLQDLQDVQADLQKDLQADLQVRTGLEATQQISSLVLFPLQAETSTEREKSMGGTCEQGPNHVSGELSWI